jgi:hypothetical protein
VTEDLNPGVYLEEVAYRSEVIPGVIIFLAGMLLGVAAAIALDMLDRRRLPPAPLA